MKYAFFLYSDEVAYAAKSPEEMGQEMALYNAYIGALQEAGVLLAVDWLQPTATATTVSVRDGETVVHDGPFAETKEQLGGYFVIEVPSLDAALEWAKKCPGAYSGKVEIRASAMPV